MALRVLIERLYNIEILRCIRFILIFNGLDTKNFHLILNGGKLKRVFNNMRLTLPWDSSYNIWYLVGSFYLENMSNAKDGLNDAGGTILTMPYLYAFSFSFRYSI